jgi:hypothetical protein
MAQDTEGFAGAIHELRRCIEAALTGDCYYLAAQKLRELRQIAGPSIAVLADRSAPLDQAPAAAAPGALPPRPVPAPEPARPPQPEDPPASFGEALGALRASIKMDVWDDRYYEAIRLINALTLLAAAGGAPAPQARLSYPRSPVVVALRRVRRVAAVEFRDNLYYGVARHIQALAELLPQPPLEDSAPAPAASAPQASGPGRPRSFDDLAVASARRVARLAHPASLAAVSRANGEDFERRSSEPCAMGERLR